MKWLGAALSSEGSRSKLAMQQSHTWRAVTARDTQCDAVGAGREY